MANDDPTRAQPKLPQVHGDDEFTFDQLVAHGRDLFGCPSWAVEAALTYEGQTQPQTVAKAKQAVARFMSRVAA